MIVFALIAYTQTYTVEYKTNYNEPSNNLMKLENSNLNDCRAKCDSLTSCAGFVIENRRTCFIRRVMGESDNEADSVSYTKQIQAVPTLAAQIQEVPTVPAAQIPSTSPVSSVLPTQSQPFVAAFIQESTTSQIPSASVQTTTTSIPTKPLPGLPTEKLNDSDEVTNGASYSGNDTTALKPSSSSLNQILLIILSILLFLFAASLVGYTVYGQKQKKIKAKVVDEPAANLTESGGLDFWVTTRYSADEKISFCSIDVKDDSLNFYTGETTDNSSNASTSDNFF